MKKIISYIAFICITASVLSGCADPDTQSPGESEVPEPVKKVSVEAYLQSEANTKYTYEGEGIEFASYVSWVDYKADGSLQLRSNNGGTEAVNVYKVEDGKLILAFVQAETYHRENMIGKKSNVDEVMLMEPLEKGNSWTLEDGAQRSITDTDASIETPSGTYTAIEVTTINKDSKTLDYYAEGTGLVKTVFIGSDDFEVTSSLSQIERDVKLLQNLNFYYPNIEDEKYYYKNIELEFQTNDIAEELITRAYKENVPENAAPVLSENAKLNSFYLDQEAGIVHLDLNKEFLAEMNAGSSYESMILQSLANTLGGYCMGEKLSITLDGEIYSSGHIMLEAEDYITVDLENTVEAR